MGGSFALGFIEGAQKEVATCSPILILLSFLTFSAFLYI
jgi:hypothetical protein